MRSGALLVVVGPTGTGKSAVSAAVAQRLGGEVVGCDALQLYRGFDIGTAKPTPAERRGIPHHLIDTLPASDRCSLAEYVRLAEDTIAGIVARRNVPLIVGGTGMYLRGLLRGVMDAPPPDPVLRERLRRMIRRFGAPRLHQFLERLDPTSAARLDPRDTQRVERALELALSGETWSARLRREGTWSAAGERYRTLKIGLDLDRETLARRIDRRVDAFFAAGLVGEVQGLLARGVPIDAGGFKAIGYREVRKALAGDAELNGAREQVQRNTRAYVKRQRTWFRKEPGLTWLDASRDIEDLAATIVTLWQSAESAPNGAQSSVPGASIP